MTAVTTTDVCLVSMPFPPLNQPSMALGLLTAALTREDIGAVALYPCLWFAEEVGLDAYQFVSDTKQEFLIGEWVFAPAAFGDEAPEDPAYLDMVLAAPVSQALLRKSGFRGDPRGALHRLRLAVTDFVDKAARRVLAWRPRIVGCTSTFMQQVPSLALLRRVKQLAPDVVTMIGGANCEAEMGAATARCFPWVDYVVSGEADLLLPGLCRRILAGEIKPGEAPPESSAPEALPYGVIVAGDPATRQLAAAPRAMVDEMDRTAVPDFATYYAAVEASPLAPFIFPGLAVETSRGCWWGKKHHCTFCGLNGGGMTFRSKSPDRVVCELETLATTYGIRKFNVVDNILDLGYIETVLPRIADARYTLFFETKSNLRRDQLEQIAAAGIRRLQPGIETMHDAILRLIDKGTTALINLRLLKWARELGIFITWNFLWDVPGEQEAWYEEMAAWLPRVSHLQPPGIDRIQFHRFSPYHSRQEKYGLELVPFPTYAAVYPLADADLRDLAYYFHDSRRRPARTELEQRTGLKQSIRHIAAWNRAWLAPHDDRPILLARGVQDGLLIVEDTRPAAVSRRHALDDLEAKLLAACAGIRSEGALRRDFADVATPEQLRCALDGLDRRGLILQQDDRILSLVLDDVTPIPDADEDFPGGYVDIDAWQARAGMPAEAAVAAE